MKDTTKTWEEKMAARLAEGGWVEKQRVLKRLEKLEADLIASVKHVEGAGWRIEKAMDEAVAPLEAFTPPGEQERAYLTNQMREGVQMIELIKRIRKVGAAPGSDFSPLIFRAQRQIVRAARQLEKAAP